MNAERPVNQADEEAPLITQPTVGGQLIPPPPEISFRSSHQHRQSLDDDNDSLPSELSSLMPLSTLTPNYNPDLQYHCHHSNPSGNSSDHTPISSKKAFRLAAFLGILSFVVLAGLDVVYFVGIRPSEPDIDASVSPKVQRSIEEKTKADKKKKKKKDPGKVGGDHDNKNGDIETKRTDYEQEGSSQADEVEEVAGSDGANSQQKQKTPEVLVPTPEKRCAYVVNTFEEQNEGFDRDFLKDKYKAQSADPNVFYRATAVSHLSFVDCFLPPISL